MKEFLVVLSGYEVECKFDVIAKRLHDIGDALHSYCRYDKDAVLIKFKQKIAIDIITKEVLEGVSCSMFTIDNTGRPKEVNILKFKLIDKREYCALEIWHFNGSSISECVSEVCVAIHNRFNSTFIKAAKLL